MRRRLRTRVYACWSPMDTRHGSRPQAQPRATPANSFWSECAAGFGAIRCVPTSHVHVFSQTRVICKKRPHGPRPGLYKSTRVIMSSLITRFKDRVGRRTVHGVGDGPQPHGCHMGPGGSMLHGGKLQHAGPRCACAVFRIYPPPHQDPHPPHFLPFLPCSVQPHLA